MTLDQPTGYSYLHPVSRIASFVVKGPGTVRVRATQALQVTLTILFELINLVLLTCASPGAVGVVLSASAALVTTTTMKSARKAC